MAEMLLSEAAKKAVREEPRFRGIRPVPDRKIQLPSSRMYEEEAECMKEAFRSGPACENVDRLEEEMARLTGVKYAAALNNGSAAVHMMLRLAAERIYGSGEKDGKRGGDGTGGLLEGRRVFCSDLASSAMAEAVVHEGGEPVFIDVSCEDWGMDPEVLETAFGIYPDVKIVMMAHLYGFPGQAGRIKEICERHGALLIEDVSESLGAKVSGKPAGSFGDYGVLRFQNNDSVPGTEGGMLLTDDFSEIQKAREWTAGVQRKIRQSPQDKTGKTGCGRRIEDAAAGTVCGRMEDVEAGIILDRIRHLEEYKAKKKAVYEQYEKRFSPDLMLLNPVEAGTEPNYRTPCMTVESGIGFMETRTESGYEYIPQHGTAAPMEILEALEAFGVRGKPVRKPLHMRPAFKDCDQITLEGSRKEYDSGGSGFLVRCSESEDIYRRGICLPADMEMTKEEQDRVIDIIYACYSRRDMDREIWRV